MPSRSRLHAVAWLVWAVAAVAAVQLAPNPLYVVLVVAIAFLVVEAHGLASALRAAFPLLVVLGVSFGIIRVVLTTLTTHDVGSVAFRLPEGTLPRILGGFTVGGTVEWPVLLQAGADALVVVGVMAAFGAFNAVASHHELVQSAPRAFHEPGLVVTVALAFVPSTLAAAHAAREADRARTGGRVVRRGRLVRLLVPILESGIERAVHLAESMDSRGFARRDAGRSDVIAGWCGLAGLLGLGGAFVALVGRSDAVATALAAGGVLLLGAAVLLASGGGRAVRYRPRRIGRADITVGAVALASPVILGILSAAGDDTLRWSVEPLVFPPFAVLPAVAVALLAAPVALVRRESP